VTSRTFGRGKREGGTIWKEEKKRESRPISKKEKKKKTLLRLSLRGKRGGDRPKEKGR